MKLNIIYLLFISFIICSCSSSKNITYLQDAETLPPNSIPEISTTQNTVVMPGDLIDIIITGFNMEAVKPFNRQNALGEIGQSGMNGGNNSNSQNYYLVDESGNIDFPILGKIHIGGMNKTQIKNFLISELCPKYLTEPLTIDIRFRNFKVSVLGEVGAPGVYVAENERLNILEAIAMAGDLSIKGKRENVMIIRTNADGTRTVNKINLMDKNLILSPYYNLQQNDIVYVEPNSSKARESWSVPPLLTLSLGLLGTAMSLATFIITLTK